MSMSIRVNGVEYYKSVEDYLETEWLLTEEDADKTVVKVRPFIDDEIKRKDVDEFFYLKEGEFTVESVDEIIKDLNMDVDYYEDPMIIEDDEYGLMIQERKDYYNKGKYRAIEAINTVNLDGEEINNMLFEIVFQHNSLKEYITYTR
jgi:hypothetical protein